MRTNIERGILVGLLALSYLSRAPGLIRQGSIGAPALVVGFVLSGCLIVLLLKSSAKAAVVIAFLAAIGGFVAPVVQLFVAPALTGAPRPEFFPVALMAITSIVAAFCAFDLWSEWRKKKPNKAPEPTA